MSFAEAETIWRGAPSLKGLGHEIHGSPWSLVTKVYADDTEVGDLLSTEDKARFVLIFNWDVISHVGHSPISRVRLLEGPIEIKSGAILGDVKVRFGVGLAHTTNLRVWDHFEGHLDKVNIVDVRDPV